MSGHHNGNCLLLSIHPQHANNIFAGIKTVELRRIKPRLERGDWILVYVSSPIQALKGVLLVERVTEGGLEETWSDVANDVAVTKSEFDSYFKGTDKASAISIRSATLLPEPISLERLKKMWPGFTPPQSFRYVSGDEFRLVLEEGSRMRTRQMLAQMPLGPRISRRTSGR